MCSPTDASSSVAVWGGAITVAGLARVLFPSSGGYGEAELSSFSGTSTGTELWVVDPLPNWPNLFPPQQYTSPARVMPQVCIVPVLKDAKVSGTNFELLVGFDVTPEMADFNRQGKRFRPDAGETAQVAAAKQ